MQIANRDPKIHWGTCTHTSYSKPYVATAGSKDMVSFRFLSWWHVHSFPYKSLSQCYATCHRAIGLYCTWINLGSTHNVPFLTKKPQWIYKSKIKAPWKILKAKTKSRDSWHFAKPEQNDPGVGCRSFHAWQSKTNNKEVSLCFNHHRHRFALWT